MWLSYLPSVGKVIWCYRRTIGDLLSKEISREETEEDRWGGTAYMGKGGSVDRILVRDATRELDP